MMTCSNVSQEMLIDPINVKTTVKVLDFSSAKQLADHIAKEHAEEPMLLASHDSISGLFSPDVTCCSEEKPEWLVFAENRGENITIDINDEQYILSILKHADEMRTPIYIALFTADLQCVYKID